MRAAAADHRYERAAWLRRRRERIAGLVGALGRLAATHSHPRLVLAPHPHPHPRTARFDAFWLVGGRVADWDALECAGDLHGRTLRALSRAGGRELAADAVGEARLVQTWLAGHHAPALALNPVPADAAIGRFVAAATRQAAAASEV